MEMLADNIIYLKKKNPALYEVLKKKEENLLVPKVMLEDTKNNQKTLKIKKDDKALYLHSKYDPIKEAELIIDKLEEREEITQDTHVIFYGLGLGYHLDVFFKRFPQIEFSIYEPSVDVLSHYLNQRLLKSLPLKQLISLQCGYDNNGMNAFFKTMITGVKKQSIICDLPPYQKVFKEEYKAFLNQFREVIKSMRNSMHTNYAYKKRWILNSVFNFKEVLTTPNILMENKGIFKGKTAILVSAGPSLNYEIENLKLIKEKGLAYIFTVGSAINTLIHHDLYPDAMCTYDPTEENLMAFKKAIKMGITSIPMIFGTSVGYETLLEYKGPKYHMITNQDTASNYFLKIASNEELVTVSDAPTVAVVTLELLHKLGFEEVILVGQNLAYLDKNNYAEGVEYQRTLEDMNNADLRIAKDVFEKEVFTTDSYLSMKKMMEMLINHFGIRVVNTTKGGIKIEGAQYIELDKVIKEKLKKNMVSGDEFENILRSGLYNQEYIKTQLVKMINSYEVYQGLLPLLKQNLIKMDELITNKNEKQAAVMHKKFDVNIAELEANDFAKVFALPMNRVEHDLLAMNIQRITKEKNELKKMRELIGYLNAFINLLYGDSQLNQQIIDKLIENIRNNEKTIDEKRWID